MHSLHQLFTPKEVQTFSKVAEDTLLRYRRYNRWLNVYQVGYGKNYRKYGQAKLPEGPLRDLAVEVHEKLWVPRGVSSNTAYLQLTTPGTAVKPHRDPLTDLYFTTITYLGGFTDGQFCYFPPEAKNTLCRGEVVVNVRAGDTLLVPCTVNGKQGPLHWTKPHQGNRYTLILNHNVK